LNLEQTVVEIKTRIVENRTIPFVQKTKTYSDNSILIVDYKIVSGLGLKQDINFTPANSGEYDFIWTQGLNDEFNQYRLFNTTDELHGFELGRGMFGSNDDDFTLFEDRLVEKTLAIGLYNDDKLIHATSWDDVEIDTEHEMILTDDYLKVEFRGVYVNDSLVFDPLILDAPYGENMSGNSDFGNSLSVGDFNNDAYDDALIGAPDYSSSTGRTY